MEIVAVFHNIRSLHNVGSLFRTADAAGVTKLYLCGITPTPLDRFGHVRPQLAKVALGAEQSVAWEKASSASVLIKKLKRDGFRIVAIEQDRKAMPYYNKWKPFDPFNTVQGRPESNRMGGKAQGNNQRKLALIVGNEVNGIPKTILRASDTIVEIPMRKAMVRQAHHPRHSGRGKESLNVVVAFGIVVFHILNS